MITGKNNLRNQNNTRFVLLAEDVRLNKALKKSGYQSVADVFKAAKDQYLDSGTDSVFFEIPKNKDLLLRLPTETDLWKHVDAQAPEVFFKNSTFHKIDKFPGFRLGQALAESGELRLHSRISGFPHGVQRSKLGEHDDKAYRAYEAEAYDQYQMKLKKVAAMPQSAYTSLARFLIRLQTAKPPIYFDPTAGNLMVSKRRFRMIDPSSETDVLVHHCTGNNLAGMTAALLDSSWVLLQKEKRQGNSIALAESDPALQRLRREIVDKCVRAAKKTGLPYAQNPFPTGAAMHASHDLAYAFKISGLTTEAMELALGQLESKPSAQPFWKAHLKPQWIGAGKSKGFTPSGG